MNAKYLLPCRCGRQMTVEPREAGQTSLCPCGQSLLIPTMLEITRLEPAPAETSLPPKAAGAGPTPCCSRGLRWLWWQSLWRACFATLPGGSHRRHRSQALRLSAHKLPPLRTWQYWQLMKQGLDRRVDQMYMDRMTAYHFWQGAAAVTALIGVALIGSGVAIGKKRRGEGERGRQGDRKE